MIVEDDPKEKPDQRTFERYMTEVRVIGHFSVAVYSQWSLLRSMIFINE
jgi:hypothetical protein